MNYHGIKFKITQVTKDRLEEEHLETFDNKVKV